MNEKFKTVATVYTGDLLENKNKRDICTNASNCGVQFKKEKDNNSGRRPRRPENETKTYK